MVNPKLSFPAKKLPSYLKGLVDSRARADGVIQRLAPACVAAEAALSRAAARLEKQQVTLARAKVARNACDILLKKWSEAVDTEDITPVHAWRGRYGERGALQKQVLLFVEASGDSGVATGVIADQLSAFFGLAFLSGGARTEWVNSSLAGRLKALVTAGHVERICAPDAGATGKVWRRVRPAENDFDSLHQQAESAALAIKSGTKPLAASK